MITYTKLAEINQSIYRNIYINSELDEFDDLTDDVATRKYAHLISNIKYNVIDYIFSQENWQPSRFGDGTIPIWYGSGDIVTSFYETAHHWKKVFIQSPNNFSDYEIINTNRNLFSVNCNAALLDLRDEVIIDPRLIDKNPSNYFYTQQIGHKIFSQGQPGLISKSARHQHGDCIAIFNKTVLTSPQHQGDYMYSFEANTGTITISDKKTKQVVLIVR